MIRNHTGHRMGECHQKARLSAEQVKAMRAEYIPYVVSIGKLAKKYGCGKSTARDILNYSTRAAG
jgi:hypothetical protein|tara:strand:- start:3600 stop:3794 length:195 start_codon:yes stop_codon:yes gene_type:complete